MTVTFSGCILGTVACDKVVSDRSMLWCRNVPDGCLMIFPHAKEEILERV